MCLWLCVAVCGCVWGYGAVGCVGVRVCTALIRCAHPLCTGSADGGKTVKGIDDIEDKQVKAGLRLAADRLNLADHIVNKATCQFAGDVEGHVGTVR